MKTLQLDWETEQKRSVSYFNQIMEVEKERDQVRLMAQICGLPNTVHQGLFVVLPAADLSWHLWLVWTFVQYANMCCQALRSRDSLQLEYTDCLLDKNHLRKRIAELQANLEQQQRELEREGERSREQMKQSSPCPHCVS